MAALIALAGASGAGQVPAFLVGTGYEAWRYDAPMCEADGVCHEQPDTPTPRARFGTKARPQRVLCIPPAYGQLIGARAPVRSV